MKKIIILQVIVFVITGISHATVTMEWVTVGDVGNTADTEIMNDATTGYGSVSYIYLIGKYEVTNAQYCGFLSAVAATDTYSLYNIEMTSSVYGGIERSGSSGSYTYSVKVGWENKPVNFVSFYDCLRFANWLHNGQLSGEQDASTTEDGAYDMSVGSKMVRKVRAQVWLPSEDEWYKAAYYKAGGTGEGYWNYATETLMVPTFESPPGTDMVNGSVNYNNVIGSIVDVGAYDAKPSDSAYGTFDQNGNLLEWNEALIVSNRGLRGGAFNKDNTFLKANYRGSADPSGEDYDIGFRLAGRIASSSGVSIYVDDDATLGGDGQSWSTAYKCLQDALAVVAYGDEIRVAQGIYKPDRNATSPDGTGDQNVTFQLVSGVAIYGGYAGLGELDPNTRDVELYETVLSGDLDGDDVEVNPPSFRNHPSRVDNSNRVVFGSGTDGTAVLDGLTITAGHTTNSSGGGIHDNNRTTTIISCTFSGNYAGEYGGGMASCKGLIIDCTISGNYAYRGGGGMMNCKGSIINCTLSGNYGADGGGMYNWSSSPTVTNCLFIANQAIAFSTSTEGGGMYNYSSTPVINNCTFSGNYSYKYGGGVSGSAIITNCIFWNNTAGGSGPQLYGVGPVSYSDVQGGYAGTNIIDSDPCFADPANEDYHLKSAGGRWAEIGWIIDGESSACIDAGDPNDSIGDENEPHGYRINMGAYGGTEEASKTPGLPITFPESVENFSVTGAHKKNHLYWESPLDNGGTDILMYKIYRGLAADNLSLYAQVQETELSLTDNDVQNGANYYYAISAINGLGEGNQSGVLSVTAEWNNFDLNGDGIINLADIAIISNEWLWESSWH